ncbi:hypothetical protein CUS28_11915 [Enterococcus faecium]|nr:hypothetical protein CUS93_15300 [Enterococcus faecium]PQG60369.1 hypothetical protein CUS28_11915 [Enterococcus faecium]
MQFYKEIAILLFVLNDSFKVSLKIIKNSVDAFLISCYNNEVAWMRKLIKLDFIEKNFKKVIDK